MNCCMVTMTVVTNYIVCIISFGIEEIGSGVYKLTFALSLLSLFYVYCIWPTLGELPRLKFWFAPYFAIQCLQYILLKTKCLFSTLFKTLRAQKGFHFITETGTFYTCTSEIIPILQCLQYILLKTMCLLSTL